MLNKLKDKLLQARKDKDEITKNILSVVVGDIQTITSRAGQKDLTNEQIAKNIQKIIASNSETIFASCEKKVIEEVDEDEVGYSVIVETLPGCCGEGNTKESALESARGSLIALMESYNDDNKDIPWENPTDGILKLDKENKILQQLLPKAFTQDEIKEILSKEEVLQQIKNAKSDGQATGVAMNRMWIKSKEMWREGYGLENYHLVSGSYKDIVDFLEEEASIRNSWSEGWRKLECEPVEKPPKEWVDKEIKRIQDEIKYRDDYLKILKEEYA